MNKIEKELIHCFDNIENSEDVRQFNNCYSLLEKHCIEFGKFAASNFLKSDANGLLSIKQLFKLYIEEL